jgi:GDP-D-mannose dehydratase
MSRAAMSKQVVLITDVTGQDGAYLAEFLLPHCCKRLKRFVVGRPRRKSQLRGSLPMISTAPLPAFIAPFQLGTLRS